MNTLFEYPFRYNDAGERFSHSYILPEVLAAIKGDKLRILELGCGNGFFSNVLLSKGHEVTAVDLSASGIEIAKNHFPGIAFIHSDIYNLLSNPITEESHFDLVVSIEVVEHLQYPRELLRVAKKYLRKGGLLVITTPYHGYLKNLALSLLNKWDWHFSVLWDGGHVKFFSPSTIRQMLNEEGFSDIKFNFVGRSPFLWKSMITTCRRN